MRRLASQLRDTARVADDAIRSFGLRCGIAATRALRRAGRASAAQVRLDVPGLRRLITLRAGTSDAATFVQIFLRGDLDFPLPRAPKVIVDGGANIGLSALYLHRRFPQARIVAVEFERSNHALLERNVAGYPAIIPVHAGLWPSDGVVAVANPDGAKWAHYPVSCAVACTTTRTAVRSGSLEPGTLGAADASGVRALSLPTLMSEQGIDRIDLLKLDIEGSEFDLFSGDLSWMDRVSTLAIELHERSRPGSSGQVLRAIAMRAAALRISGEYLVCELGGGTR